MTALNRRAETFVFDTGRQAEAAKTLLLSQGGHTRDGYSTSGFLIEHGKSPNQFRVEYASRAPFSPDAWSEAETDLGKRAYHSEQVFLKRGVPVMTLACLQS